VEKNTMRRWKKRKTIGKPVICEQDLVVSSTDKKSLASSYQIQMMVVNGGEACEERNK